MGDLLAGQAAQKVPVCEDMWLLPRFAPEQSLWEELNSVVALAPFRHMQTKRGHSMSVAMTNCGPLGWVSDRRGYRYQSVDPLTGKTWPAMPEPFWQLACSAAAEAGFQRFAPDACLINRYAPGSQMSAHQDRNEADLSHPIVSVSLGLPARFFVQGAQRRGKSIPVDLVSGDVIVWGGRARLHYHGVRRLKAGSHPLFGSLRYNLTFRQAA